MKVIDTDLIRFDARVMRINSFEPKVSFVRNSKSCLLFFCKNITKCTLSEAFVVEKAHTSCVRADAKKIFDSECYLHSKHENKVNAERCENSISSYFCTQGCMSVVKCVVCKLKMQTKQTNKSQTFFAVHNFVRAANHSWCA